MALPVVQTVALTPGVWTTVTPPVLGRWVRATVINNSDATISVRSNSADATTQVDIVSGGERKLSLLGGEAATPFAIQPASGVGPALILWSLKR